MHLSLDIRPDVLAATRPAGTRTEHGRELTTNTALSCYHLPPSKAATMELIVFAVVCYGLIQIFDAIEKKLKSPSSPGRRDQYREFLRSPQWRELKNNAIKRNGNRCRVCNSDRKLEVHHRYYPKTMGTETLDALTTLCRSCHSQFHGKSGPEPTDPPAIQSPPDQSVRPPIAGRTPPTFD